MCHSVSLFGCLRHQILDQRCSKCFKVQLLDRSLTNPYEVVSNPVKDLFAAVESFFVGDALAQQPRVVVDLDLDAKALERYICLCSLIVSFKFGSSPGFNHGARGLIQQPLGNRVCLNVFNVGECFF